MPPTTTDSTGSHALRRFMPAPPGQQHVRQPLLVLPLGAAHLDEPLAGVEPPGAPFAAKVQSRAPGQRRLRRGEQRRPDPPPARRRRQVEAADEALAVEREEPATAPADSATVTAQVASTCSR